MLFRMTINAKNHWLFICLWLFTGQVKVIGQEILHQKLTKADGLLSNTIFREVQDSLGNIWMATGFGVSKYNGKTFEHFTAADGLCDNDIISVHKDSKGRIWFLGYNGTSCFWLGGKIYNEQNFPFLKNIKTNYCFINLFEDSKHRLWFGSAGIIVVCNLDLSTTYPKITSHGNYDFFESNNEVISIGKFSFRTHKDSIYQFYNDFPVKLHSFGQHLAQGGILMFTDNYLVWRKEDTAKILLPLSISHKNSKVISVWLSNGKYLWLGGDFGLELYDFKHPERGFQSYFKNTIVTTLFEDKEGSLWVNTIGSGIILIPKWAAEVNYLSAEPITNSNECFAIQKINTNQWVLGLDRGKLAIGKLGEKGDLVILDIKGAPNKTDQLYTLDNKLYACSFSNTQYLEEGNLKQHQLKGNKKYPQLNSIKQITNNDNYIYYTGTHSIFRSNRKFTSEEFQQYYGSNQKKFAIYSSLDNKLYLGVENGLKVLKGNKFIKVPQVSIRVNHIAETPDSALLLATFGSGLLIFKNNKIIRPLQINNLRNGNFGKKARYYKGKIFLLAEDGLHVYTWKDDVLEEIAVEITFFFSGVDIFDLHGSGNEIGLATSKGAFIIPISLFEPITTTPFLTFEKISNPKHVFEVNKPLALPYQEREISFVFTSPNIKSVEALGFRYKLKEDGEWVYTKENKVSFPFLASGDYTFLVQAKLGESAWSKAIQFPFSIATPFWETWWFTAMLFLLVGSLILYFLKLRINAKRKQEIDQEAAKQKLRDLEQQALLTLMNPHFVFNVMNSIQGFINSDDPKNANKYLSSFARLIRMNLDISFKKYISLSEEIDYLNLYVKFEDLRLDGGLNFTLSIKGEEDLAERKVAAMMVQPFIENAIWHGLANLEDKKIVVTFNQLEADLMEVTIEDNGKGIDEKYVHLNLTELQTKAHGMGITFQRLQLINHYRSGKPILQFKHLEPNAIRKGTQARVLLPLN